MAVGSFLFPDFLREQSHGIEECKCTYTRTHTCVNIQTLIDSDVYFHIPSTFVDNQQCHLPHHGWPPKAFKFSMVQEGEGIKEYLLNVWIKTHLTCYSPVFQVQALDVFYLLSKANLHFSGCTIGRALPHWKRNIKSQCFFTFIVSFFCICLAQYFSLGLFGRKEMLYFRIVTYTKVFCIPHSTFTIATWGPPLKNGITKKQKQSTFTHFQLPCRKATFP